VSSLERDRSPFAEDDLPTDELRRVRPGLVVEIGFEEWTKHGRLRQPRYEGLREDKDAADVVREEAAV
jgi:bifunctional non-homologous end joining protein LigD